MKTQVHDLLHGAALTQVVEHKDFKALNKASTEYGHYQINEDRRLWVKYLSKKGPNWQFKFSPDEARRIQVDAEEHPDARVFVVLVCGDHTVCLLSADDLWSILDRNDRDDTQTVRVSAPQGRSMEVSGPLGGLGRTVRHNSFPDWVME